MLDQRLLRDNPAQIAEGLGRRGTAANLDDCHQLALETRDLEQQRSELQAEGNRIGREVGELIKAGAAPGGEEVKLLRQQGAQIKHRVGEIEEQEKGLEAQLQHQLLVLPNLPSPLCPTGRSEADNVEVKRWAPRGWPPKENSSKSTGRLPNGSASWTPNARCGLPRAAS